MLILYIVVLISVQKDEKARQALGGALVFSVESHCNQPPAGHLNKCRSHIQHVSMKQLQQAANVSSLNSQRCIIHTIT